MSLSSILQVYTKKQDSTSFYVVHTALLTVAALGLFLLLLLLKSLSIVRFNENPPVFIYSIVLFVFQLSRLMAALIYVSRAKHYKDIEELKVAASRFEPTATFVIPCMNEEQVIFENIAHCYEVDYPIDKIEVIAVNDGSTDGTLKEMRRAQKKFPNLQIVNWEKNKGKRAAMATAIKMAKGDIIIQLDSDSYIEPTHFRALLTPFETDEIAAVCAHADPTNKNKNLLTRAQAGYYFMAFRILKAAESTFSFVLCCSGCCSAYRRETIMPLIDEFANESFLGVHVNFGDDRSLTNLILKNGYRTIYVDNVQAYTIVPETFRQLIKQQIRWKKSWFINTIKASKYMWRVDPFIAATYFYPLAIVTVFTPIMAVYGLLVFPIMHSTFPVWFLAGTLVTSGLFMIMSSLLSSDNRHWYYLLVWSVINTFVLTFLFPYALLTIRDNKWGTR